MYPFAEGPGGEPGLSFIKLLAVHYTIGMRRVVIIGPPPVQVLDVTRPLEVFSTAPGYEVRLANPGHERNLKTNRGIVLGEATPIMEIESPIDTLVIAGGQGAESGSFDPVFIAWLREAAQRCRRIASICTGAFVLAEAGLLNGRKAVTHWNFCERLTREYPEVKVMPDPIYLRDGNIYTSAGITAGIDLSLALVEEDHGHQTALQIARQLVMFLVRPGGQAQYSHMLSHKAGASQPLRELQVWMLEHLRENLTVEALADRMGMSARNFTRVCLRETGMNPGQFVDRMRVEAAQQRIDGSAHGMKEIADAVGFRSTDAMRRGFVRVLGVTAAEYASRFRRQVDGEAMS
jgi:transcriptional regulator GlxA family with amidase domain